MHQGANREANVAPSNYFANNRGVTKCWRQPLPLAAPQAPPLIEAVQLALGHNHPGYCNENTYY